MMMMMKNPVVLVICVLLFSCLTVLASENSFGPDDCCFNFITRRLAKDRVLNYKHTDARCTKKAVLFTMKRGAVICADPSVHWVKNIINFIQSENVNRSPAEPVTTSAPHFTAH